LISFNLKILKNFLFILISCCSVSAQTINFDAKGLIYLQDSDFGSFSYTTKKIDKAGLDKMGSFMFPLQYEDSYNNSEQIVSNSVMDNFKSIALKSDNRLCYVLESKGPLKKDEKAASFAGLPDGGYVSVIDISNLRNLKPDYRFPVALNPKAIALSKNNEYLAVAAEGYNQELQIFELNEFGKPIRVIAKPSQMANGAVSDVIWHPKEDYLVYIKQDTKEIGLVKIIKDGPSQKIIRLEQSGSTIKLDGLPKTGLFTNNGKYFLVLDTHNPISPEAANGQVFVIKFNLEDQGSHSLISKAFVEENPTAMTINPEGNSVLVTNAKKSFEYPINERTTGKSSLSVLDLSPDGTLTNKNNLLLNGILPSGLSFDKTGKNFAISFFQYLDFGKPSAGIDFYKFSAGLNPKVEKQASRINTSKGIHFLKVIEDF
jgi:DNA-binding beta-propeller fold protein YncE